MTQEMNCLASGGGGGCDIALSSSGNFNYVNGSTPVSVFGNGNKYYYNGTEYSFSGTTVNWYRYNDERRWVRGIFDETAGYTSVTFSPTGLGYQVLAVEFNDGSQDIRGGEYNTGTQTITAPAGAYITKYYFYSIQTQNDGRKFTATFS